MRVRGPGGVMTGADPKTALWTLPGAIPFFAIWCFLLINASSQWVPAWVRLLAPLGWAVWGVGGFFLGRFIYRGLYDLSHPPEQVVGQVVQLEYISGNDDSPAKYIVALDEGGGQDAVTYEVSSSTYGRLTAGSWLRLDVTPKLRHVHREEIIIRE
jgi:hypothetical protein